MSEYSQLRIVHRFLIFSADGIVLSVLDTYLLITDCSTPSSSAICIFVLPLSSIRFFKFVATISLKFIYDSMTKNLHLT